MGEIRFLKNWAAYGVPRLEKEELQPKKDPRSGLGGLCWRTCKKNKRPLEAGDAPIVGAQPPAGKAALLPSRNTAQGTARGRGTSLERKGEIRSFYVINEGWQEAGEWRAGGVFPLQESVSKGPKSLKTRMGSFSKHGPH